MSEKELLSPSTRSFVLANRTADVRQLALKGAPSADIDMTAALQQIDGWQRARRKLPVWAANDGIIFPPHISMEQCSSEATALYKQRLAKGGDDAEMADLTGGFGVDFSYISRPFAKAWYVEQQEHLCQIARHNFRVLGMENAEVVNATAEDFLCQLEARLSDDEGKTEQKSETDLCGDGTEKDSKPLDTIYLDPARRDTNGKKTYAISDCTPDVVTLLPRLLCLARRIIVKLSPMLDHREAVRLLEKVTEVHILSVSNECKETLLVIDSETETAEPTLFCVNDDAVFRCPLSSGAAVPVLDTLPEPGMTLYVPNASVMKGGCFGALAERFGLAAVGSNSHLFCARNAHSIGDAAPDFPGRTFIIRAVCGMNRKETARCLAGVEKANIATRNFPLTADALRKKLKLRDGGETYIFGTTAAGRHALLVTEKC